MRVRDHVAISSAGAALLYPVVGRAVVGGWLASILIDADHYLWFCLKHRCAATEGPTGGDRHDAARRPRLVSRNANGRRAERGARAGWFQMPVVRCK